MLVTQKKDASTVMVIIAFAAVYLVWGSTYFFIQKAVQHIPAFLLGFIRFTTAGILLLTWCVIKKEKIWDWRVVKHAALSGVLMLFLGNGAVIWAEQSLPSSLVAVLVSAAPLWFVLLDKPKWKINFHSRPTLTGLVIGFAGVVMLFSESITKAFSSNNALQFAGLLILIIGSTSWAGGSLYAKYNSKGATSVNSAWQMIAAGIAFLPGTLITHELNGFQWQAVTAASWLSLFYLILFGSLAAYSAYVWLLQVRPATQVSTYAYVNPVVAVLLGVLFAGESMTWLQVSGLTIVLLSVLLINIARYRQDRGATPKTVKKMVAPGVEKHAVCTG